MVPWTWEPEPADKSVANALGQNARPGGPAVLACCDPCRIEPPRSVEAGKLSEVTLYIEDTPTPRCKTLGRHMSWLWGGPRVVILTCFYG